MSNTRYISKTVKIDGSFLRQYNEENFASNARMEAFIIAPSANQSACFKPYNM